MISVKCPHPCIDNQCLSLQIQRYLCPTGSALKSIFGVVNDKCTFILLACFPKLGHPLCLLCFCFFIFHNRYLSLLEFRFIMDLPAKLQQFSDIRKFFPSFAKFTYQKSDRFAVRPLHCPTATLSGCAGVPACLTASLSDHFAERLNYYPIVYQSDSERSERSFVFQRVSAVVQSQDGLSGCRRGGVGFSVVVVWSRSTRLVSQGWCR